MKLSGLFVIKIKLKSNGGIDMSSLPYIQLYVADYLASTMHLSVDEHGAYLLLIMNYWQTGKPIKEKHIRSIAKLDNERYENVIATLKEFFNVTEDGFWIHDRIERDLINVYEKSRKASEAGKKSAIKRWGNNKKITNVITNVTDPLQQNGNHKDKDKDKEYIKESNTLTSITKDQRSGSRLASDWYLPEDWLSEAKAIRSDLSTEQIRRESESFKDYWVGKAGKDAAKLDWQATWRNWIRRSSTQAVNPKKFDPFEYVNRSAINGHATIDITPKPVDSANTEIGYIEHKTTFQPF
jgi:uncharacterized protein YdaU (DUF1376 family)